MAYFAFTEVSINALTGIRTQLNEILTTKRKNVDV